MKLRTFSSLALCLLALLPLGPAQRSSASENHIPLAPPSQSDKSFTNKYGIEFVLIPAGNFNMGGTEFEDGKPIHKVGITQAFYLGKYEITQGQWEKVMEKNPSFFKDCAASENDLSRLNKNCPVERVTWDEASDFVNKLNKLDDGYKYSLPSEAQWEYAARAGSTADSYGNLKEIAWFDANSDHRTHPVGRKLPNSFGLYDMMGNVEEWCADDSHKNYEGAPSDGSAWVGGRYSSSRIVRGGAWLVVPRHLRSAHRFMIPADSRYSTVGFRVMAVPRTN